MEVLTATEVAKRSELACTHPLVYAKQQRFDQNAHLGRISPIIRVCWNYLCNFTCDHCCAETRMPRHLLKIGKPDKRRHMNHEDLARFAQEADEYGLFRMVLTGGEPTAWPDLFRVIEILDPKRHLVIMDSNAWLIAEGKKVSVQALADAGVYKMQISLDSFIEADHDEFRKKPGSYKRVMQVLPQVIPAGMKLLVSTCLVRGRAFTQEFEDLCKYCTDLGAMLYITYAKPTGTCGLHEDWVINKADADRVRELEARYDITTHMTPSDMRDKRSGSAPLGHYAGCITVKGIDNLEPTGDIVPCPYMDLAIGNVLKEPLATILDRGMRNRYLGPQRDDCLIGEDSAFIQIHNQTVRARAEAGNPLLPVPYGEGFADDQLISV